jgi:hypothetical protein
VTAIHQASTVASRIAVIEAELDALAGVADAELVSGFAFDSAAAVLRIRRRVDALAARTSALPIRVVIGPWMVPGQRKHCSPVGGWSRWVWWGGYSSLVRFWPLTLPMPRLRLRVCVRWIMCYPSMPRTRTTRAAWCVRCCESHILNWAATCQPSHFKALLNDLCHRFDPDAVDDADGKKRREVFLDAVSTFEGFVNVSGFLDPETGQQFIAMLESARRTVPTEADPGCAIDARSAQLRNVEALRRVLSVLLHVTGADGMPTITGVRPVIQVTITLDDLLDDAHPAMGWLQRFGYPTTTITRTVTQNLSLRRIPGTLPHRPAPGRSWPHSPKSAPSPHICAPRSWPETTTAGSPAATPA